MKTKLILLITFLVTITMVAQQGINYKAIVKDNLGNVVANQSIYVQIAILEGATTVYQESHTPTTNVNGFIILNIGEGTTSDDFSSINWGNSDHFLNVQIDTGSGLVDLGSTQFMAVPYAFYAETSGSGSNTTGLEAIDEGNGLGWRLTNSPPENYGDIGNYAVDLSLSNIESDHYGATGVAAFTANAFNQASGELSTAMGRSTTASGNNSTAIGYWTSASGNSTTAMGRYTSASGYSSIAMGSNTKAEAFNSTAIGRYNIGGGTPDTWIETDPLFEIGNGEASVPSNALTVLKNGTITAPSFDISEIIDPKALITKEYMEANAASATGLEALNEGNGMGWRLVNVDSNNYGNIGNEAIDLSINNIASTTDGATGSRSVALGFSTEASGVYALAIGYNTEASGETATAMGLETEAAGDNSTAMGKGTSANGVNSLAAGELSFANGKNAIAIGNGLSASALYSTAIGGFNTGGGDPLNWVGTDPVFEIGNGTGFGNKSNALTVFKNGTIIAPSFELSEITDPKALITKEYLEANGSASTGLEALDEGNGNGWRLIGREANNYGNIGLNAIDLSSSNTIGNTTFGATGNYSFATGYQTISSGDYSVAIGSSNYATGNNSMSTGFGSIAMGDYSLAMGRQTLASGSTAIAMGYLSTASGPNSTAMGNDTEASGENATAFGHLSNASGFNSIAAGTQSVASSSYSTAVGYEAIANGQNAVAIGRLVTSSGNASVALGTNTSASGAEAFAMGNANTATGGRSVALGYQNNVTNDYSFAMGNSVNVSGFTSGAVGYFLNNDEQSSFLVGKFNDNTTDTNALFMVGNGGGDTTRSNAFMVFANGELRAPSLDITEITNAKSLITKEYLEGNYIGVGSPNAPSGLEVIDEGNGIGWRLVGRDLANLGNIGYNAVDFSDSHIVGSNFGATGSYSVAFGLITEASGRYSIATGLQTNALGDTSTAMGNETTSSGYSSTAMGGYSTASGDFSTSIGVSNSSSAYASTALGGNSIADDDYSTVLGLNNDNTTSTSTLFQVGNGDHVSSRSNALTVLDNGYTSVGTHNEEPTTDFQVYHDNGGTENGFKLLNKGANKNWWRFYTLNSNGNLYLYSKTGGNTNAVGSFNSVSGVYSALSDRRVKDNFKELHFNWQDFMQLKPLSYHYKTDKNKQSHIGFVAQDVQPIYPELVNYNQEGDLYQLNYSGFGVVAIKAIQEQQTIIENQQKQIDELKELVQSLLEKQ